MSERRVPTWYAATGLHGENARVYEAFQRFLHNLPLSYTELAEQVGVSQPAVSRWASDVTHPSLGEMSEAVEIVRSRLDEISREAERFAEVLRLIEEAMRLYDLEEAGRADLDPHQQRITSRLRSELDLGA
ncbi:MAG: helix-turn-helix transcriptional regulator [Gemmatimonadetes bacterium]|nr:helix-turn-helix transcriptional regulator [Gemmatimonadota bacterium]